jgi:hypothetical protein
VLGVRPDYIEHQLAAVRDPNGRAYNRTTHLPEWRKVMQQWADYLDDLAAVQLGPKWLGARPASGQAPEAAVLSAVTEVLNVTEEADNDHTQ